MTFFLDQEQSTGSFALCVEDGGLEDLEDYLDPSDVFVPETSRQSGSNWSPTMATAEDDVMYGSVGTVAVLRNHQSHVRGSRCPAPPTSFPCRVPRHNRDVCLGSD